MKYGYGYTEEMSLPRMAAFPSIIPTMLHEWYMPYVINPGSTIITIPDTGTIKGKNLSNPAANNKPIQTTINSKLTYKGDGIEDYVTRLDLNFLRSLPTWMIQCVIEFDITMNNQVLNSWNNTNIVSEGWTFIAGNTLGAIVFNSFNSLGVVQTIASGAGTVVDGGKYVISVAYNGTNTLIYRDTTLVTNIASDNLIQRPTQTDNISLFANIRPAGSSAFGKANIGYVGVDSYDATRLTNNITTLKALFGL